MSKPPSRSTAAGIAFLVREGTDHGTPLILLHGIGSQAESWWPLMQHLPASVTALAWDAPGYGNSAPLDIDEPEPGDYAISLLAWLDALRLAQVALVGHSLGCLFAARFAMQHPSRVAALALLSPALGYGVLRGQPLPATVQVRIDDLAQLGPAAFAERRAARLVFQPEKHPQVLAGVRRGMGAVNLRGYAQAVRALGAGDLLADASRLPMAPLVAAGAQDVVTPPENAERLRDALPRCRAFTLLADCGHALPQQAPEALARLLTEHGLV